MKYNILYAVKTIAVISVGMFLHAWVDANAQSQQTPILPNTQVKEMDFTNPDQVQREVPRQKGRVALSEVTVATPQANNGQQTTATPMPAVAVERHYLDNATRPDQPEEVPLILYNNTIKNPE